MSEFLGDNNEHTMALKIAGVLAVSAVVTGAYLVVSLAERMRGSFDSHFGATVRPVTPEDPFTNL